MKISDILHEKKDPFVSFEIIPPARGRSAREIYDIIDELIEFKPPFIDVTSHAADSYFVEQDNGTFTRHIKRKRPGTIGLCAAIKYRYRVEAVPHLLCQGFTKQETEDALIELNYLGIDNVLAIRGDQLQYEKAHPPGRDSNEHALDLVNQISNMNRGKYLEDILDADESDFCIGVGGYPEKHPDAPSKNSDIRYLKKKVDAGAQYIVTQMFFDNSEYFRFVDDCKAAGINVPIIPGLKPLTTKRQASLLPSLFHIDVPEELYDEVDKCKDNEAAYQVGVEWCIAQSQELIEAGVPVLHYYTMSRSENIHKIAKAILVVYVLDWIESCYYFK